ncbi:protein of unknown function [Burkholderia multivorans]
MSRPLGMARLRPRCEPPLKAGVVSAWFPTGSNRLPAYFIREKFGSGAETSAQLLAAFASNPGKIVLAISPRKMPDSGQRLQLGGSDF